MLVAMLDIYSIPALRLTLLAAGAMLPVGLAAIPPASGEWNATDHPDIALREIKAYYVARCSTTPLSPLSFSPGPGIFGTSRTFS
jgi:hypothetical protein